MNHPTNASWNTLRLFYESIVNSYSQIFFSKNKLFGIIIIFVTFFTVHIGVTGFLSVLFINLIAFTLGYSKESITEGIYGFNALFLGLALGYFFEFNLQFSILFIFSVMLLFILTIWLYSILGKINLPFLSLPFIFSLWIVLYAGQIFQNIEFRTDNIFIANTIAKQSSSLWYAFTNVLNDVSFPEPLYIYFKTLAGILFQNDLLAGVLLCVGLLFYSRIAFTLSLLGFFSIYYYYIIFGIPLHDLNYYMSGSNFIFLSISIGCFYLIPNIYSYSTVLLLIPVFLLFHTFINKLLIVFQLPSFTISFSLFVPLFLFVLYRRWFPKFLFITPVQYYVPEKSLHHFINSTERAVTIQHGPICFQLPFIGEWKVSQGYDGGITHLDDWGKALDFVIVNKEQKTFQGEGIKKDDFYCYNKPIVAPANGFIYSIINHIEDNDIEEINIGDNWGNSIILNHLHGVYSQISHIKKDSFKVKVGDYVEKGTMLASCGNSGRSPEPHIHFQVQSTPSVGAKSISYAMAYFAEHDCNIQATKNKTLRISQVPRENKIISNVESTTLLQNVFSFLPGKKITATLQRGTPMVQEWEIFTDAFNRTYIYCSSTKSIAYFINDGTMFYFTDFYGEKTSALFQFYLSSFRVLLGYDIELCVTDSIPLFHFQNKLIQWLQDFISPFYIYTKVKYTNQFINCDNPHYPNRITIQSDVELSLFKKTITTHTYTITIEEKNIRIDSNDFSFIVCGQ